MHHRRLSVFRAHSFISLTHVPLTQTQTNKYIKNTATWGAQNTHDWAAEWFLLLERFIKAQHKKKRWEEGGGKKKKNRQKRKNRILCDYQTQMSISSLLPQLLHAPFSSKLQKETAVISLSMPTEFIFLGWLWNFTDATGWHFQWNHLCYNWLFCQYLLWTNKSNKRTMADHTVRKQKPMHSSM